MNFNKNPNRSFDKPSFEGRKEKETLNVQAEFLISQTSDVSPRSRPFQWLVTIPDIGKEKGSLERVGSYCRYKQSEGKQTEEKCMCVCVSTHPGCMEHATTIQFEALRPEACDNITATRYVLGVCTPSPPLFLSVFPSARARMEEDG